MTTPRRTPGNRSTRRTFIAHTSAAAAASLTLPSLVRAQSPNAKPNLAIVGTGGRGWADINEASGGGIANVIAACDVDANFLRRATNRFKGATGYSDWRKMLENKDIDGVIVATPDHMHAPIGLAAMRAGMHLCSQKPLTHNVREARIMRQVAAETKAVTQMGIQGHSGIPNRLTVHAIQNGAVGKVKTVHVWTDRPGRWWPQPATVRDGADAVPAHLDWDAWLGVAPERPYLNGVYHAFKWRGHIDFGTGAVGDMAIHLMDPIYAALKLTAPTAVTSHGPAPTKHSFPKWSKYTFVFPGTQYTDGPIEIVWYDGGKKPDAALAPGRKLGDNGAIYVGSTGSLLHNWAGAPRRIDEQRIDLPKLKAFNHYALWTQAIAGNEKTNCPFEYSGPLTESVLLGTVAARFPGKKLAWDTAAMKVTNEPAANAFVTRSYRKEYAPTDLV